MKELDGFNSYDLTGEGYRKYHYPDGSTYRIDQPDLIYVKETDPDSHRVVDESGGCHIPSKGWIAISFDSAGLKF